MRFPEVLKYFLASFGMIRPIDRSTLQSNQDFCNKPSVCRLLEYHRDDYSTFFSDLTQ